MPVFLVTYTSAYQSHDIYETEWVCDASYDHERAREAFRRQFPSASIVHVKEKEQ